jgi:hypothetical protein
MQNSEIQMLKGNLHSCLLHGEFGPAPAVRAAADDDDYGRQEDGEKNNHAERHGGIVGHR